MAIQYTPIYLQALETLLQTTLTTSLDRCIDDCFFTNILISRPFVLVFQECCKAWLEGDLPNLAWSQD